MWVTYIFLVLWIFTASCQDGIGEPCPEETDEPTGVCTLYEECSEIKYMVEELEFKATYCSINGRIKVVCCPYKSNGTTESNIETTTKSIRIESSTINPINTPVEMSFLEAQQVGIFRWNGMVCRFDGNYPITCYRQEYPRHTVDPERDPIKCPKITWPKILESYLSPHLQLAWEACRNYAWESTLCNPTDIPGHYTRDDCMTNDLSTKVADGEPAARAEFPHMAVLGIEDSTQVSKKNKNIIWYGGGSLISEYFILTAGHVIYRNDHKKVVEYAMIGAINKTDVKSGVLFHVARTIAHPDYRMGLRYHDIAILELNRRVRFSEFIRPICLKVTGIQTPPERYIAGWGKTGDTKADSAILLKAKIFEKPPGVCVREHETSHFIWNSTNVICAGAMAFGSDKKPDSCQGDSGGPLMARIRNLLCARVVVGVVSWGPTCGVGKPGIYTNAASPTYLEWIARTVWS